MSYFEDSRSSIRGDDFALSVSEYSVEFMQQLNLLRESNIEDETIFKDDYVKLVNSFNKKVLELILCLPLNSLASLLKDAVNKEYLDPNCVIIIEKGTMHIQLTEKGTIQ